ncbi:crAss001_48 related protein [Leyella stercorea]|uniref:crAss001_48 related protein n=1 Tax=Leyella stercorea TaxID=363265 RepID=UPI0026DB4A7F|nr:hypothetical protein [Leyella stercorea]
MNEQMKQYTGTKTVKAMPMTMGGAYERKLLKEGVRPSECETDKAGYLVEYEGGYQSWSPADVFEKAYKPSETRLDRLRIECDELRARSKELDAYLNEDYEKAAAEIGRSLTMLLVLQSSYLHNYLDVLEVLLLEAEKSRDA